MTFITSKNPATGEVVWEGLAAGASEVVKAVETVKQAFASWSQTPLSVRIAILQRFANLLKQKEENFSQVISEETGKPLWEAKTEVGSMVGKVDISVKAYEQRTGGWESEQGEKKFATRFRPHGVVAVLGPFNFPGHLPNGHITPALLAGNTVVFKPSELAPKVAQEMTRLWQEAGLPAGVLQTIQGGRETGQSLLKQDIRGVFFTGSFAVGLAIHEFFAKRPDVILALEMGGNNPLMVTEVKDKRAAAYLTIQSAFITAGQRCTCARRLIVPRGEDGDKFIAELVNMTAKIRVGPHTDRPEPFMGPVITAMAAEKILKERDELLSNGAQEIVPVKLLKKNTGLLTPGILDVTRVNKRKDEEIFGPLLQVIRVTDFNAGVKEVGNTAFGLAAGLISDRRDLYEKFCQNVRAGVINWNNQLTGAASTAPFGGVGLSGNFRPSAFLAADYCAYPVASLESATCALPKQLPPGIL